MGAIAAVHAYRVVLGKHLLSCEVDYANLFLSPILFEQPGPASCCKYTTLPSLTT